jgi:4-hydroxybenzoate polyprenyltransferase
MVFATFRNYLSLIKFSHTVFALPFAIIVFFLAVADTQTPPDFSLFLLVLLCMLFARSAAMAFNRYADRRIDGKNPRTRSREIPAGIIRPKSALIFVISGSLLFVVTTGFINQLCLFLSPLALLIVLGYSFTKRFTAFSHFVLGLGLSLAPIGAYIAVSGYFSVIPILYSGVVLFWVGGFDIIYALQDEGFDKQEKLKSIPAWIGKKKALYVSILAHIISLSLLYAAGTLQKSGVLFWTGALIFTGLLIYQHLLVKPRDISRVNLAFAVTNGWAGVLLALFAILDLYYPALF